MDDAVRRDTSVVPSAVVPLQGLTDPDEVLAIAGVSVPEGAAGAHVDSRQDWVDAGFYYAYTVSWDAPKEVMEGFLVDFGTSIDHMLPAREEQFEGQHIVMAIDSVPEGSLCANLGVFTSTAGKGYTSKAVLLDGPDFTTIHVGIWSIPN
ncbi:MAG: hypothetical protein LBV00_07845 [Propionibacteriaceae bacterium]|nr:hypothetical protein [Propionibacteriaceae bacterium]